MNKTQPVFELSLRPTESVQAEPQRTDVQLHMQAIGELIHALLAQLDLLQHESSYGDDLTNLNLREEVQRFEINSGTASSKVNGTLWLSCTRFSTRAKFNLMIMRNISLVIG